MLRKPGQYDHSVRTSRAQSSNRRKTAEGPDDIVRKLQRLPGNKKCADCGVKLPQAVNLNFGTFVCSSCCGIHREFNHRIKSVGHSAFTEEEALFLSKNGNEVVNARYLANFDNRNERMKAPDGTAGPVDPIILRVWFRRKYLDRAWMANNGGQNSAALQPTRAQLPPKNEKKTSSTPVPETDLLGGWASTSAPVAAPASTPAGDNATDAAWDAFGQSRSSVATSFDAFGSKSTAGNQQPAFQADFGQMPGNNPPPAPMPASVAQQPQPSFDPSFPQSPDPPQQQQVQASFNPNFPQPSTPNRSQQASPTGTNFPAQQPLSVNTQQQMGRPSAYHTNFIHNTQVAHIPSPTMSQSPSQKHNGFHPNLQQEQSPAFSSSNVQQKMSVAQQQQVFNFQRPQLPTAAPPLSPVQQELNFNANFQQPSNQPQVPVAGPPIQQHPTFNANFKEPANQPQLPTAAPPAPPVQQQPEFNANFHQPANQPQLPTAAPPTPPVQQQPTFNASFQQPVNHRQLPTAAPIAPAVYKQPVLQAQMAQNIPLPSPTQVEQTFNTKFDQPSQQQLASNTSSQTSVSGDAKSDFDLNGSNGIAVVSDSKKLHTSSSTKAGGVDAFDAFSSLSIGVSAPSNPSSVVAESIGNTGGALPSAKIESSSPYSVGQVLNYTDSQHNISKVEVLKVHLDDDLVPFYEIRMSDGREKQTDNAHLSLVSEGRADSKTGKPNVAELSTEAILRNVMSLLGNLNSEQLIQVERYIQGLQ